ncbi:sodium:solute symporter family protein [Dethiobacter alkaliphilus]|uniref:sodium:solute symporter family protein n=1 Tax=Dethiobacter alkaliphilus TaxID=427926 RepID=UPI00031EB826|nr:sodium:solute symporter family protein [Dethiobacter alkaliphilus]
MGLIIGIYILAILVIVFYLGRRVQSSDDFFLAGRKLNWLVAGGSIVATAVGGAVVIGHPGAFYTYGLAWYFVPLGGMIASLFMAFFVVERVRALNQHTVPDLLALRYDDKARTAAAILIIIADIAIICTQIMAFAGILAGFLGVSPNAAALMGAVLFVVTALGGGLMGIAFTDAIQGLLISVGLVVIALLVIGSGGGITAISAQLPAEFFQPFAAMPAHLVLGNVLSVVGITLASQSTVFQRINAVKSPQEAKKAGFLTAAGMFILTGLIIPVIGYSARVILGPGVELDNVAGALISAVLPDWAGALFIAVVVGAILTTTNSILLSTSMNVIKDLYEGALQKSVTDRARLNGGRLTVVIIGTAAFLMTLTMPTIIDAIIFAYTMTAILIVPIYIGLFWRRPGASGGMLSILLGGMATLIWQFVLRQPWGIHAVIPGLVFALVGLALGCLSEPLSAARWQIISPDKNKANLKA